MKNIDSHRLNPIFLRILPLFLIYLLNTSVHAQDKAPVDEARQKAGKKLFKSYCSSCHKLDKKLIGPALGGIEERQDNAWLKAWIKDNAAFRATGDADAKAIYEEYKGAPMTAFPQLTDKNIDDILYYTTVGELKKKVVAGVNPVAGATSSNTSGAPSWVIYILAAAIIVAFFMIFSLLKTVNELKGKDKPKPKGANFLLDIKELWIGLKQNTFLQVLTVIFVALMAAYFTFGMLFQIGVDQHYEPIQPIAFSHKIHAGDNKIDCQYCHSAAKHSKHSGIPSAMLCMNCHKNISEVAEDTKLGDMGKVQLDKEIEKIYKAVGWDAENLEYTGKTKPVKWIRVHNLPDFVYFNHSQHVSVAGLKCQKCHGPVQEMDELYQFAPLTMGWCITCHKKTDVDLKGNDYYKKVHEQLAKKYGIERVTIAQLGGKECGKCHY